MEADSVPVPDDNRPEEGVTVAVDGITFSVGFGSLEGASEPEELLG